MPTDKTPSPTNATSDTGVNRSVSLRETRSRIENVVHDNLTLMIIFFVIILFKDSAIATIFTLLGAMFFSAIFLQIFSNQFLIDKLRHSNLHSLKDFFIEHFSKLLIFVFISSFVFADIFLLLLFIFSTITATLYQFYSGQAFIQDSQQPEQIEENNLKTEITPSPTPVTVLDINKDSQHLYLLLSDPSLLAELIDTMNELHHYLPYLQQEHPYLAHSVQELLSDITTHTIHRLDIVAKDFVKNGKVKTQAKAIFAKEHESQITKLFSHHIAEIKALNESILEKQMAGFSQTGTEAERTFRNKIMELKILLKWYVAQQPDEITASSHQVILDSLQNTTLQQMTTAFYHANTSDTQRQQLQQQLDELLEHFKAQSPISNNIATNISKNTDNSSDDLLKLTHDPNTPIDYENLNLGQQSEQLATQDFIDFNKQYVKQLKQHW